MTINNIQDELIDEFASLDDKMDKYDHLISYGANLPAMDSKYKTEKYAIKGCQSRLWIASEIQDGKMAFYADSDSKIVRGMVAVVIKVVNNQPPNQIATADFYFLKATGLVGQLSPMRANGLTVIVKRINELAGRYTIPNQSK